MKKITILSALFLCGILLFSPNASAQEKEKQKKKESPEQVRKDINKMRKSALKELYKLDPNAKTEIENAAGYAVFGSTGMNLLLLSTGRGQGIAEFNDSGEEVYMKMFSGGVGVGLGVKKYYAIFVFSTDESLDQFIEEGWAAETQADAAAKTGDEGGAVAAAIALSDEVQLYQITEKGLAAQATIQGTKYSVDEELN